MRRCARFVFVALLAAPSVAVGQAPSAHGSVPMVHAVRAASAVTVDGKLDDEVWTLAPAVTEFVQRDPEEGKPVSEHTALQVAYDANAIYIGARLDDREPRRIARQLSRRDTDAEADSFWLYLDPHHDHLTGAAFGVSAAGVQYDQTVYNDSWTDGSWDAVWESAVTIDERGWTVEMRIPYSQLRFPSAARHVFGLNAMRFIHRKHEQAWLSHVPKKESGLASRFAHLDGLDGISPHRTTELVPYFASRGEFIAPDSPVDPFNDGARFFGSVGVDAKYRVSSNLLLDGTINPDFGQVEVDPAVVNLTAFETFFEEKRPFFIEGANVFGNFGRTGSNNFWGFNRAEPLIFYSRRIGRQPQGSADGDFVDTPTASTILGAAKLTGKTRRGWTLGVLDAVTGREYANAVTSTERRDIEVEPLSNYFVARAQREFRGRAGIGVLTTAVHRDLRAPALRAELPGQSYVGGVDGHFYLDGKKDWVVTGSYARSHVAGSMAAIAEVQEASQRYFGRPDATHIELDPTRTTLGGWTGSLNLNRQSGVHLVNAALWGVSPGFDSSAAGFTFNADRAGSHVVYQLRDQKTRQYSREYFVAIAKWYTWNYARDVQGDGLHAFANLQLRNYWSLFGVGYYFRGAQDDRNTRGGPSMATTPTRGGSLEVSSDRRKAVSFTLSGGHTTSDAGDRQTELQTRINYRPAASVEISVGPRLNRNRAAAQYVDTFEDPVAAPTYGSRYVFGSLHQKELNLETRVNYILSPKMSLQIYAQPLISVGDYTGFKELARPRTFDFITYGVDRGAIDKVGGQYVVAPGDGGAPFRFDDPDFNFKSLRVNAIFRWEWRPGSALYVVWTEQREDQSEPGFFSFGRDLHRTFAAPADDVLLFKIAYWFQR